MKQRVNAVFCSAQEVIGMEMMNATKIIKDFAVATGFFVILNVAFVLFAYQPPVAVEPQDLQYRELAHDSVDGLSGATTIYE